jgi:hypothetical protein
MVLPTKKIQFNKFLQVFNKKDFYAEYIISQNAIQLNNRWLQGFTEAEGCFTISLLDNSVAFRTRYLVSQKGDINVPVLSQLISLFNCGVMEAHSQKDNYTFLISGLKNIVNIYPYFDEFPFIGIKGDSYVAFKDLNKRL